MASKRRDLSSAVVAMTDLVPLFNCTQVPRARESANGPGLLRAVPSSSEASFPRGDGARRMMASWRMGSFRLLAHINSISWDNVGTEGTFDGVPG